MRSDTKCRVTFSEIRVSSGNKHLAKVNRVGNVASDIPDGDASTDVRLPSVVDRWRVEVGFVRSAKGGSGGRGATVRWEAGLILAPGGNVHAEFGAVPVWPCY